MKKLLIPVCFIFLAFSVPVFAQKGDEKKVSLDIILEADAKHNLKVAWQYFKLRKAYKAVLMRAEETIAAHPTFSKMDEILYLSGMSSYYLSIGKGKQKINLKTLSEEEKKKFAPQRLKEDAIAYLSILVDEHPKSKYKKKAQKTLKEIKKKDEQTK